MVCGLLFAGGVERGDTEGEGQERLLSEACVMQMADKRFPPTEGFDAPVQIGVCRFVAAEESPHAREHVREIDIVTRAHEAVGGIRELQDEQLSTGSEDAVHLS